MPHAISSHRYNKLQSRWDPLDRYSALKRLNASHKSGEILTGLLYIDPESVDLHANIQTTDKPLNSLGESEFCPGSESLEKINLAYR